MKFLLFIYGSLASASFARSQYFSDGWKPGQSVTSSASTAPAYTPAPTVATTPLPGGSFFENFLASEQVVTFFEKLGVNITERLGAYREQPKYWDERIPLITDDNYKEMIVEESLTQEEEKARVWFLVISATASKQDSISKFVDEAFDSAYNITQVEGDLPNVRWGRIDYFNVTAITTRWGIWRAPYIVVLKDRGQTLRFYQASQLRLKVDLIRDFLKTEAYEATKPWTSSFSPGGNREYLMNYFAIALMVTYNKLVLVPKWVLWLITGGAASFMMNFLHSKPKPPPSQPKLESKAAVVTDQSPPSPAPLSAGERKPTRRKSRK